MFQLLIDSSDINALNALYVSIFLGIALKLLWAWSVEYSFVGSLSDPARTNITHPLVLYRKKSCLNGSFILKRIIIYFRRKEYSQDDTEEPISSLFAY